MPEIPKREVALERNFISRIRNQGARVRHLYETGSKQSFDGLIGFRCFSFSYEAKHTTNKIKHGFKSWRNGKFGHQFDELRKDYLNKSTYPFKLLFWQPVKEIVTIKIAAMSFMVQDQVPYEKMPTAVTMEDIMNICLDEYGINYLSL